MKGLSQKIGLVLILIASLLLISASTDMAAAPPELIVNHALKQCAVVTRGDECVTCEIPPGWELVGRIPAVACPQDYEEVDVELICKGERLLRCCLPGHSGGQGDCGGLALQTTLILLPCCILLISLILFILWLVRRNRQKTAQKEISQDNLPPLDH